MSILQDAVIEDSPKDRLSLLGYLKDKIESGNADLKQIGASYRFVAEEQNFRIMNSQDSARGLTVYKVSTSGRNKEVVAEIAEVSPLEPNSFVCPQLYGEEITRTDNIHNASMYKESAGETLIDIEINLRSRLLEAIKPADHRKLQDLYAQRYKLAPAAEPAVLAPAM